MVRKIITGIIVVLTIIYLIAVQNVNGSFQLPFIFFLPSSLVLVLAGAIGYGVAWASSRGQIMALKRELRRIHERAAHGPAGLPSPTTPAPTPTVPPTQPVQPQPTQRTQPTKSARPTPSVSTYPDQQ